MNGFDNSSIFGVIRYTIYIKIKEYKIMVRLALGRLLMVPFKNKTEHYYCRHNYACLSVRLYKLRQKFSPK